MRRVKKPITRTQALAINWLLVGCLLVAGMLWQWADLQAEYQRQITTTASSTDATLRLVHERITTQLDFHVQVAAMLAQQADLPLLASPPAPAREFHLQQLSAIARNMGGRLVAVSGPADQPYYSHPSYARTRRLEPGSLSTAHGDNWLLVYDQPSRQASLQASARVGQSDNAGYVTLDFPLPTSLIELNQDNAFVVFVDPCHAGYQASPSGSGLRPVRLLEQQLEQRLEPQGASATACQDKARQTTNSQHGSETLRLGAAPYWDELMLLSSGAEHQEHVFVRSQPLSGGWRLLVITSVEAGIERIIGDLREAFWVVVLSLLVGAIGHRVLHDRFTIKALLAQDALTGMANRPGFVNTLESLLRPSETSPKALLYIDLDKFKQLKDTFGASRADDVLRTFAGQLQALVKQGPHCAGHPERAQFARVGSDEFAVLLDDVAQLDAALAHAQRIHGLFEHGFETGGVIYNLQASIGIALYPADGRDAASLLHHAAFAMKQAKADGGGATRCYTNEIGEQIAEQIRIDNALRDALALDLFELVFMPVYRTSTRDLIGAEVLLRCRHVQLASIGPDRFIPAAEASGLIKRIDLWVIEHAFQAMRKLQAASAFDGKLFINFSAVELRNDKFAPALAALMQQYQIAPHSIELEVTETSLVDTNGQTIQILKQLKALGVSLALDDFGTGYTGFNQLQHYPVETLKIDRSFIQQLRETAGEHRPIAEILIELSRIKGLQVVAEGVETEQQLRRLQQLGCEFAQGYLLSKPLPLAGFIELLGTQSSHQAADSQPLARLHASQAT